MLRTNSILRSRIGPEGYAFLEHAVGAIERILPHIEISKCREISGWRKPGAVWTSPQRTQLRVTISIRDKTYAGSLTAFVQRRSVPVGQQNASHRILDLREQDICRRIALQISQVLTVNSSAVNPASLQAVSASFDEIVIATHLQKHHDLEISLRDLFIAIHKLAEQTYENKALTFGCILDRRAHTNSLMVFPRDFLGNKKYRALSDGYRTAYYLSSKGQIVDFVDLDMLEKRELTGKHFFPSWAKTMAKASRDRKCGIILSRQGDLLVFDEGSLRFTYRYGKWQYWNHAHLLMLLRDRARAQHVQPNFLGRLIGQIYRSALDISFRRCGALFVVLRNAHNLDMIARPEDVRDGFRRSPTDIAFDNAVSSKASGVVPHAVIVELASLDGAVVLNNAADLLAYAAVLRPRKSGRLRGSEGSRTKAAIGASFYGLAIKVSSDGDITVYHGGKEFIRI
jgi:hypothetical protein